MRLMTCLLTGILLGGCNAAPPAAPAAVAPATTASDTAPSVAAAPASADALPPPDLATQAVPTDAWLGTWTGPEGTALELARSAAGYDVTIRSLDGPATYAGDRVDAHIEFTRGGKRESIVATDGAGTGMKWLADKHDCLVIAPGEGFCRDR